MCVITQLNAINPSFLKINFKKREIRLHLFLNLKLIKFSLLLFSFSQHRLRRQLMRAMNWTIKHRLANGNVVTFNIVVFQVTI